MFIDHLCPGHIRPAMYVLVVWTYMAAPVATGHLCLRVMCVQYIGLDEDLCLVVDFFCLECMYFSLLN